MHGWYAFYVHVKVEALKLYVPNNTAGCYVKSWVWNQLRAFSTRLCCYPRLWIEMISPFKHGNANYIAYVLSRFSHVCLCATLWTVAHQTLLSMGFSARILEWVVIPFSRGPSWLRDQTHISHVSCIASDFFTAEPLGKPANYTIVSLFKKYLNSVILSLPPQ